MVVTNTQEILNGIYDRLKEGFPEKEVYVEDIKQGGSDTPYFFVKMITSTVKEVLGGDICTEHYCIQYYPETENGEEKESCYEMSKALYPYFAFLKIGEGDGERTLKLNGREANVSDNILSFYFWTRYFIPPYHDEDEEEIGYMETLYLTEEA